MLHLFNIDKHPLRHFFDWELLSNFQHMLLPLLIHLLSLFLFASEHLLSKVLLPLLLGLPLQVVVNFKGPDVSFAKLDVEINI